VSIIERIKSRWNREQRSHPSVWDKDPALKEAWIRWFGGSSTSSGVDVTPDIALELPPVFACVRVVTETISTLPVHVYRRERENGRTKSIDTGHPLSLLLREPNPEMTRVEFLECMIANQEARENAYAIIERTNAGETKAIWPVPNPRQVRIRRNGNGDLEYEVKKPSGTRIYPARDMIHLRPLLIDGVRGVAPITYLKETIGLGLAALRYGAGVFGGDGLKRMALVMEGTPRDTKGDGGEAFVRGLAEAWKRLYGGKSHDTAVLHSGLKPMEIGINPEDAQLTELLKVVAIEACRAFRVPPSKIMELERAHFNNIEHLQLDFRTDTILPRCIRIEQEFDRKLLVGKDAKRDFFIRFNLDGLLRGDYKSRMEGHHIAIQAGILSPNEARDEEDRNPYDGGDVYLHPLNMSPAGLPNAQPSVDGESTTKTAPRHRHVRATRRDERNKIKKHWLPVLEEAYTRLLKREQKDFREASERFLGSRSAGDFMEWLDKYSETHADTVKKILGPAITGLERALSESVAGTAGVNLPDSFEEWISGWVNAYSGKHAGRSANEIKSIIKKNENNPEALLEEIARRIEDWTNDAAQRANDRVTQSDGAIAREVWRMAGVKKIRWEGGDCDFCSQLNGAVVGIESDQAFVKQGSNVSVEGKSPMWAGADVLHPPLHPGCDCYLVIES